MEPKGNNFPVTLLHYIWSPSTTRSNSDHVHHATEAWWNWMWWAWDKIGTGGRRWCPVCSGTASCASLWVPLWLSEPALCEWVWMCDCGCAMTDIPLLTLIVLKCLCLLSHLDYLFVSGIVSGLDPMIEVKMSNDWWISRNTGVYMGEKISKSRRFTANTLEKVIINVFAAMKSHWGWKITEDILFFFGFCPLLLAYSWTIKLPRQNISN